MSANLIQDHGWTHEDPQRARDNYVECRKCHDEVPPTSVKYGKCAQCWDVELAREDSEVIEDDAE